MTIDLSTPAAPDPIPEQIWAGTPNVVLDGKRYAIGWQSFPAEKGGPAYVIARRGILGGRRVMRRYPLTRDGWARAWAELARLNPATAEKTRLALGRLYAARPPAGMHAFVPGLVLSVADPPVGEFVRGQAYDLRFDDGGLKIARSGNPEVTAEYRYCDVAAVQLTGFERVLIPSTMQLIFARSWIRPDDCEYRTHLRVLTAERVLDFWQAALPREKYGWLEPVSRAIRQAWLSAAADKAERHAEWLVSELSRLAERLEHGALTRSDFELLKARITGGY